MKYILLYIKFNAAVFVAFVVVGVVLGVVRTYQP